MANCVVVRAYGRQLDHLRGEASRISRGFNADWWIERSGKGAEFWFEHTDSKKAFALVCQNLGVQYNEVKELT